MKRFSMQVAVIAFASFLSFTVFAKNAPNPNSQKKKGFYNEMSQHANEHARQMGNFRKGLKHRVEILEEEVETIQTQITVIQADIDAQNETILEIQDTIVELSEDMEINEIKIEDFQNELAMLTEYVEAQNAEILALIEKQQADAADTKSDLADLTITVSEFEESTQAEIDGLTAEIQFLKDEVETNQNLTAQQLADITYQITVLSTDVQSLNSELIILLSQYNQLQSRITTLEQNTGGSNVEITLYNCAWEAYTHGTSRNGENLYGYCANGKVARGYKRWHGNFNYGIESMWMLCCNLQGTVK